VETLTVDRWLYQTLTGDTTLMALVTDVHTWPVPQGAALPYVLFQEQAARDVQGMGAERLWATGSWLVRVVSESASWGGDLEAAAKRIDTLLQAQGGTVSGGTVFVCVREHPFRLVESAQSRQFRHLGGIYRIMARQSA
jgi:hypothetical protein